jgi:hypothetical protein
MCQDFQLRLLPSRTDLPDRRCRLPRWAADPEMTDDPFSFAFTHIEDPAVERVDVSVDVVTQTGQA